MEKDKETKSEHIYEPIRKIDVFTTSRIKMTRLGHALMRLAHDGQTEKFREMADLIHANFQRKLTLTKDVKGRMELADMLFTALEAEVIAKRVKYDISLYGSDIFKEMLTVIPFTSNPRVSSMTYLARYGSSLSMCDGIDTGLDYMQYAKEHAEYVSPCKDTGMVFYIEVNLLSQKYEASSSACLKQKVLKTCEIAISQFENESEDVRNDFQRMLMLKMVFCYLGIGLFGRKIKKIETTSNDMAKAKQCLDFIERTEVWKEMEKRRKMLFLLAKSEYYRQIGAIDLAKMHAKESKQIARINGWKAELPNIECFIKDLELRYTDTHHETAETELVYDLIQKHGRDKSCDEHE